MTNYLVRGGNAVRNGEGLLLVTTILMSAKTGTNHGQTSQHFLALHLPDLLTTDSWGSWRLRFSLGEAALGSWGKVATPASPGRRIPRWINSSLLVLIEIFLSRPGRETMWHCAVTGTIVRDIIERISGNKLQSSSQSNPLTLHTDGQLREYKTHF